MNKKHIDDTIYITTDGGCRDNGKENNIGAYACILQYKEHIKEVSGAVPNVTNNQMELTAVIEALKCLKSDSIPVEVYVDSAYVLNGITSWISGWKKKGWRTASGAKVKNVELWRELDSLVSKQENANFYKVKGHSDDELNNRADLLVNLAMDEYLEKNI